MHFQMFAHTVSMDTILKDSTLNGDDFPKVMSSKHIHMDGTQTCREKVPFSVCCFHFWLIQGGVFKHLELFSDVCAFKGFHPRGHFQKFSVLKNIPVQ